MRDLDETPLANRVHLGQWVLAQCPHCKRVLELILREVD